MSDINPVPSSPSSSEPPKATDATQKKQTVRISLPPKPSGGPSIRIPAAAPATAPAAPVSTMPAIPTSAPAAPVSRPAAPATGPSTISRPAAPAAAATPTPRPTAVPSRPSGAIAAGPSGLDVGLGFAVALLGIAAVAYQWFVAHPL